MSEITDARFARLHWDPRFQRQPKKERRAVVEEVHLAHVHPEAEAPVQLHRTEHLAVGLSFEVFSDPAQPRISRRESKRRTAKAGRPETPTRRTEAGHKTWQQVEG